MTGIADWMIKTCFIKVGRGAQYTMVAIKRGATTKRPSKINNWSFLRTNCFTPALDTDKPMKIIDKGVVKLPKYCKSLAKKLGNLI